MKKFFTKMNSKRILTAFSAIAFSSFFLAVFFSSCASTLQQDVFQSSDLNKELADQIAIFEDRFIAIDSTYLVKNKLDSDKTSELHKDIATQLEKSHLEPVISAHITAIDGILYTLEGKTKKAEECYTKAKSIQAGDTYVLLLSTKLQKNNDERLNKANEILSFDDDNAIILLEKGKLLYAQKKYDKAIAAIDEAFLIFDNQHRPSYRTAYREFRDSVWKLYSSGMDYSDTGDLSSILTKESMVQLTASNTALLEEITAGAKLNAAGLLKKVNSANMFCSATDTNNAKNSADLINSSKQITRKMCARYLWNLYVQSKGNPKLLTKYSTRYKKLANAKSPVADIKLDDPDFDAILGTVENEIMSLPDGKNFKPNDPVSVLDFLNYLNALK
ncbi:MAG: S-layer homology domain-containing protein [Treponema sp.]|nr:S-layer homology domain-containing protein [Treponema sp.]